MGKKYIVEIGRLERLYKAYINGNGKPNMTWLSPEVDLTPYTEPDLEQVRKEAYQKGYETGYEDGYNEPGKNQQEAYQRGLSDAWEAAQKIVLVTLDGGLGTQKLKDIFGEAANSVLVLRDSEPADCVERIKAYEQEQQIQVGDEVAFHHDDGRPDTVVVVTYIGQDGFIDGMDGRGTQYAHKNPKRWTKTGRTFPELAAVLEKMRGEQS